MPNKAQSSRLCTCSVVVFLILFVYIFLEMFPQYVYNKKICRSPPASTDKRSVSNFTTSKANLLI